MRDGQFVGYGDIQGAVLETGRRRLTGVRFVGADGKPAWYDENGRSLKRQFLKSPLPFEPRITSGSPCTGCTRCPATFARISAWTTRRRSARRSLSVAAGTVETAGWSGEAGRMVDVRHAGGYETHVPASVGVRPGHSSRRARDSGTTARASRHDRMRPPGRTSTTASSGTASTSIPTLERSRMPPGEPIAAAAMPAFTQERDRVLGSLDQLLTTKPAPTKHD